MGKMIKKAELIITTNDVGDSFGRLAVSIGTSDDPDMSKFAESPVRISSELQDQLKKTKEVAIAEMKKAQGIE